MELSEVSELFDQDVLSQLRCEAGGIKTVLRNSHQIFKGEFLEYTQRANDVIMHETCTVPQNMQIVFAFSSSRWYSDNTGLARGKSL
jgi:hypothetical protein